MDDYIQGEIPKKNKKQKIGLVYFIFFQIGTRAISLKDSRLVFTREKQHRGVVPRTTHLE